MGAPIDKWLALAYGRDQISELEMSKKSFTKEDQVWKFKRTNITNEKRCRDEALF